MKQWIRILWIALALATCSCSGSDPEALFDTATLEERQDNPEHARQLYQRIVDEHPQSEYATMARERLAELEKD